MRVNISAMGSVMLMQTLLLPARLDYAGDFPAQRDFAQLVAAEAELAEHAARAPGQPAAVAQSNRRGIARQALHLLARLLTLLIGALGVVDDRKQRCPPGGEFRHRPAGLL